LAFLTDDQLQKSGFSVIQVGKLKQALASRSSGSTTTTTTTKDSPAPSLASTPAPTTRHRIIIQFGDLVRGELIGTGAFGNVYSGKHRHEKVAIKVLKLQHMDADALREFRNEATVLESLRSEFIIQFRGICTDPYCIVMEYAAGGSLFQLLHKSGGEMEWNMRLKYAAEIAKGLAYLHHFNPVIIHRDLKSMNVLIDKHNVAKLTDFGLSKMKSDSSTMTAGAAGTPAYMAPELFDTQPKQRQPCDVYALGVLFWEMFTQTLPFKECENHFQILSQIMQGKRPAAKNCNKRSIASYDALVHDCWAQRPSDRPDIDTVIDRLEVIQRKFEQGGASHASTIVCGMASLPEATTAAAATTAGDTLDFGLASEFMGSAED